MIFERLKLNLDVTDTEFNSFYPERIRKITRMQWTPIEVSKMASEYLAERPGTKVLDIGSGVGKFCLVGACHTKGYFVGIEQRPQLVDISNGIKDSHGIENVKFIHANIMDVSFSEYNAFYFFNSFYENIDRSALIDSSIETGYDYYTLYTRYVYSQLAKKPVGTRLVTFWSQLQEVPGSYQLQFSEYLGDLKFFKKIV